MSEWININELPKKNGEYLVILNSFGHYHQDVLSFAKCMEKVDEYDFHNDKSSGFYFYDSEWGYIKMDNVIYWQPLPELPEEFIDK